jgi:hypothetical protein
MKRRVAIVLFVLIFLVACRNEGREDNSENSRQISTDQADDNDCGIEDGTQSATIDYYNPQTGYAAAYSLDVEVENCQVIQIDFNNGGYLDGDHIEPGDIDENGDASIEDDRGRSFEVHIQK